MNLDDYLHRPCPPGQRNQALYTAILQARERGWTDNAIATTIGKKALADGLSQAEIDATLRSAMQRTLSQQEQRQPKPKRTITRDDWLDWDSVLGAHVDAEPDVPPPREDWQAFDLREYMDALFEPHEHVAYVSEYQERDGRLQPSGQGTYYRTAAEISAKLDVFPSLAGCWVRINPTDGDGIKDANITDYRHALVECDDVPIADQWSAYHRLRLPIAAIVHSGGKSLHAIVRVNADSPEQYRQRVSELYDYCKSSGLTLDTANRNPSRLSRLPGVMRGDKPQYLLATNVGPPSWTAFKATLSSTPVPICWSDVVRDGLPELAPEIITGVLRRGHKLLISGPSKAGKSFALVQLAAAVAGGREWLGYQCQQGRVLYVNLEIDAASFSHRVDSVQQHMPFDPRNLYVWSLRGHIMAISEMRQALSEWRRDKPPLDLIVVDPVYKLNDGDENSARDMTALCNALESLAHEHGAALAFCHHFSKGVQGGKASIDRASGSGVLGRDPDAIATLTEAEGDKVYHLEWTLREFATPPVSQVRFEYPLHFCDQQVTTKLYGQAGRPEAETEIPLAEIVAELASLLGRDPTIAETSERSGLSDSTIRRRVKKADSGLTMADGKLLTNAS